MAEMDAITLIEHDHAEVRRLFEEILAEQDVEARRALFDDVKTLIEAHTAMEVQVFYPALRDAVGGPDADVLFYRSNLEHEVVSRVAEQTNEREPLSSEFLADLMVLRENFERHSTLEEEVLLPRAREVFAADRLDKLADEMDRVKEQRIDEVARELVKEMPEVTAPGP